MTTHTAREPGSHRDMSANDAEPPATGQLSPTQSNVSPHNGTIESDGADTAGEGEPVVLQLHESTVTVNARRVAGEEVAPIAMRMREHFVNCLDVLPEGRLASGSEGSFARENPTSLAAIADGRVASESNNSTWRADGVGGSIVLRGRGA